MLPRDILRKFTDTLLSDASTWEEKRNAIESIHQLLIEAGSINIYEKDASIEQSIWFEHGCAISPKGAAFCLIEISRTRLFVKGLIEAIKVQIKKFTDAKIQILDAGCGPYALLSLLASLYFNQDQVQFHVIDIHPANIEAAKKIIRYFEVNHLFANFFVGDASRYRWDKKESLHVIVCETMLNALRKEPQVAVTLQLAQQLCQDGIFIPEKVTVDCMQYDPKKMQAIRNNDQLNHSLETYHEAETNLGNLITLTKKTQFSDINNQELANIILPLNHRPDYHYLGYATTIVVYKNMLMHHNDTSLTMPYYFSRPEKNPLLPGTKICFEYSMDGQPALHYAVLEAQTV